MPPRRSRRIGPQSRSREAAITAAIAMGAVDTPPEDEDLYYPIKISFLFEATLGEHSSASLKDYARR